MAEEIILLSVILIFIGFVIYKAKKVLHTRIYVDNN